MSIVHCGMAWHGVMIISRLKLSIFLAALLAAFLPWAMKFAGVALAYYVALQKQRLRESWASILRSTTYRLILLFVAAMFLSAAYNASSLEDLLISCTIALVFPVFIIISTLKRGQQQSVLSALAAASLVYTASYSLFFDWTQLLNPEYRGDQDVDVFVALNAAFLYLFGLSGFISAPRRGLRRPMLVALMLYGFLLVLIIKSRGTLGVMLVSSLYLYMKANDFSVSRGFFRAIVVLSLLFVGALTYEGAFLAASDALIELLHLSDEGVRSLSGGSGRFFAWDYAVTVLWEESFWLGHGPRSNLELLLEATRIHGAHIALIAALVDGGALAAIPILLILLTPLVHFKQKVTAVFGYEYYFLLLGAALNESLLFTYGSPFSWVGLIALAQLGQRTKLMRRDQSEQTVLIS